MKKLRSFGIENDVPNITDTNAAFIHFLLRHKKAKTVLEVGTANGYSTICLADAIEPFQGSVTTIEHASPSFQQAIDNFTEANTLDQINPLYGDAKKILAHWKQDLQVLTTTENLPKGPHYIEGHGCIYQREVSAIPDTFDVIFLDAQKSQYKTFWELLLPRMHQETLIIVDDIGKFYEKTQDFVDHIAASRDFSHVILPIDEDDGIMLIQKNLLYKE